MPDMYVLRFPGTGGRAEKLSGLLDVVWPELSVEIWAVNPPGYGGSSGRASLRHIPGMARLALEEIRHQAAGRPVLVAGNSLGCVSALYLSANAKVDGLLLRNPPALKEVVNAHPAWWHLKLGAKLVARQIPHALNSIDNAAQTTVPAVFVMSLKDEIVAPRFQRRIIDAYAGPKKVLELPDAGHSTGLSEQEAARLRALAEWLYGSLTAERGGGKVPLSVDGDACEGSSGTTG